VTPSLNIAALTRRTGVPADTIRKWEQRYGVLQPARTPGGQRRYSELDVARIEWLKARLDEGYRIGEAASLLGVGGAVATTPGELRAGIVEATEQHDVERLTRLVDQALALHAPAEAFTSVLTPALVDIGTRWAAGRLTIAQEHLASGAVRAAVQRLLADARADIRGIAVLACAPDERHEIGLLMLGVLLRADGWQVAYLGPDTPTAEAVALAENLEASLLCFSASSRERAAAVERGLRKARAPETLRVVVGGRGTDRADLGAALDELRLVAA
jgi:DNA-binding transcriptional MerR regulator